MSDNASPETQALRDAVAAAQRDRDAANRRAFEAQNQLRAETGNRFAAQEGAIVNEIAAAKRDSDALTARIKTLFEEGNFADATAANRDLARIEAKVIDLERQKDWAGQQRTAAAADPLAHLMPEERRWVEQNPRYLNDTDFQAKVQEAANRAMWGKGHQRGTPEFFRAIEDDLYPERRPPPAADSATAELQRQEPEPEPIPVRVQENDEMLPTSIVPEKPQTPAVGRGGTGIRSVAAPPSRRIAETNARHAGPGGMISPTPEELDMARFQYAQFEPNADDKSDDAAVRWYHAFYNDPSHQRTRRREWVNG